MFGILLTLIASFFGELGASIGKSAVKQHLENIYAMGFLNGLWAACFFLLLLLFKPGASFFIALPLPFAIRAILSVLQGYVTVHAIKSSDRSTSGFVRVGTIPLLLLSDVLLGYSISAAQFGGMAVLIGCLLFFFLNHGFSKKGIWYVVVSAINAAVMTALYKYALAHGSSVEAEQFLVAVLMLSFFYAMSVRVAKKNPFSLFKKPILSLQSASEGLAGVIGSFAFLFAPASVIMAAGRSSDVLWSTLAGSLYFQEKHPRLKLLAMLGFVVGIILLTM